MLEPIRGGFLVLWAISRWLNLERVENKVIGTNIEGLVNKVS